MGGAVRMEGKKESSDHPRSFSQQSAWKRAIVIAAGPLMNIISAFIFAAIFLSSFWILTNTITQFAENSALQQARLKLGISSYPMTGKGCMI